ncbi:MAG TPA: hypothetical protein PK733_10415 [Clostridiales bacterium]|nr:hypothetical protein [Clostridiales bacterium]
MKWKPLIIIVVVVSVLGVLSKVAIDHIFSFILMSQFSEINIDMNSLLSGDNGGNIQSLPGSLDNKNNNIAEVNNINNANNKANNNANNKDIKNADNIKDPENISTANGKNNNDGIIHNTKDSISNGDGSKIDVRASGNTNSDADCSNISSNTHGNEGSDISDTSGIDGKNQVVSNSDGDINNKIDSNSDDAANSNAGKNVTGNATGNIADGNSNNNGNKSGDNIVNGIDDSHTVGGRNNSTDSQTSNGNSSIIVTEDKIKEAEKQVSTGDKLKALQILLSKLEPSDIAILKNMLLGGKVTAEEMSKAKSIIKKRVTEEEKETLKEMYNKYNYLVED